MRHRVKRLSSADDARWTSVASSRIRYQSCSQSPRLRRTVLWHLRLTIAATFLLAPQLVHAQVSDSAGNATPPTRPAILPNRWEEDWSVLADPRVPREPFDNLKYMLFSPDDPKTYLSLGADIRERFEANDVANFGVTPNRNNDYLISRTEWHADLHIADQVQVFTQFESDYAPWKTMLTPADQDVLDLEQAFVTVTEPVGDGTGMAPTFANLLMRPGASMKKALGSSSRSTASPFRSMTLAPNRSTTTVAEQIRSVS
jgi:hypothetical protein